MPYIGFGEASKSTKQKIIREKDKASERERESGERRIVSLKSPNQLEIRKSPRFSLLQPLIDPSFSRFWKRAAKCVHWELYWSFCQLQSLDFSYLEASNQSLSLISIRKKQMKLMIKSSFPFLPRWELRTRSLFFSFFWNVPKYAVTLCKVKILYLT